MFRRKERENRKRSSVVVLLLWVRNPDKWFVRPENKLHGDRVGPSESSDSVLEEQELNEFKPESDTSFHNSGGGCSLDGQFCLYV